MAIERSSNLSLDLLAERPAIADVCAAGWAVHLKRSTAPGRWGKQAANLIGSVFLLLLMAPLVLVLAISVAVAGSQDGDGQGSKARKGQIREGAVERQ